jgi:hypothetical protein
MRTNRRRADFINLINPLCDLNGTKNAQAIKATALFARHDLIAMSGRVLVRGNYEVVSFQGA